MKKELVTYNCDYEIFVSLRDAQWDAYNQEEETWVPYEDNPEHEEYKEGYRIRYIVLGKSVLWTHDHEGIGIEQTFITESRLGRLSGDDILRLLQKEWQQEYEDAKAARDEWLERNFI